MHAARLRALSAVLLLAALAACSKREAAPSSAAQPAASAARAAAPRVEGAWLRPIVAGQSGGGGYLTITSATGDRLLGGSTPVAERLELHSMAMDDGVMRMREVPAIDLPAGEAVKLAPGGLHLMLINPRQAVNAGDTVPLTLRLEKAGEVTVKAQVSVAAP